MFIGHNLLFYSKRLLQGKDIPLQKERGLEQAARVRCTCLLKVSTSLAKYIFQLLLSIIAL